MSSRLSKHEHKSAMQQSILLISLSVLLIAAFFFVLLPLSVRIYETMAQKESQQSDTDAIPPQTPILFPLPEATKSAELAVSGYAEAETSVDLFQNGSKILETTADTEGKFSFSSVPFQEGENVLYVVSTDLGENTSESGKSTVILDTEAPKLAVEQPTEGMNVTTRKGQLVSVKGSSEKNAKMYLNDKLLFTDRDGNFSGTFQLANGENVLTFRAVDLAGNISELPVKVSYNP